MSWCDSINANPDLMSSFKTLTAELYEGKITTGADFCAAMDALY